MNNAKITKLGPIGVNMIKQIITLRKMNVSKTSLPNTLLKVGCITECYTIDFNRKAREQK